MTVKPFRYCIIELPEEDPSVVFKRGRLDQVRVSRMRYRGAEWVTLRHWALDPGYGWNVTNSVALHPDELAAVAATLAPQCTVPAAHAMTLARTGCTPSKHPPSIRVLVVDDYAEVRAIVAKMLTDGGYIVTCAATGEEALQIFIVNPDAFDVLVTDLQMPPGMWGDELARLARESSPSLGVVLMTGDPTALANPANLDWLSGVVLQKPFHPADLFRAVRAVPVWATNLMRGGSPISS